MAVLPVYNMVVVPDTQIYFKTDIYQSLTGTIATENDHVVIIISKYDRPRKDMDSESFYPVGAMAVISEVNYAGYIILDIQYRVNIEDVIIMDNNRMDVVYEERPEIPDLNGEDVRQKLAVIKSSVLSYTDNMQWGSMIRSYAMKWDNIGQIAVALSPWLYNSNEERYALLEEDSWKNRFDMMEKMIYENIEMGKVQGDVRKAQEADHQKAYREAAVRKQIELLEEELNELHPDEMTDLREMEIKVENCELNEDARKEAEKILRRIKLQGQASTETGILFDYLEFLTSLPWHKEEPAEIDMKEAERILDEDHYGLKKVKKRILQHIAVMSLKKQQSGSILLFVGAPGTGKTSIGKSIARALGREYVRVSLGGSRDESDIRGHRRTYIGAMPGRIMDGIQKCGVSNPVMVLDEVDKLGVSLNGDPSSALLEVLDPEQNNTFTDHYMNVPFDLSDVLFVCTANVMENIPEPLLNRMEVIRFQGYTPLEKEEIARRHLIPNALEKTGITADQLKIDDEVVPEIIGSYTRESGVRGLKKRIEGLCRGAAVDMVMDGKEEVRITTENLREYMEDNPVRGSRIRKVPSAGMITGLAWTGAGGTILDIETMMMKGSGKLAITGQLGDVMKESARISISLIRNMYPQYNELFRENDLHIHVPDGATPKDGPSAGITMTTAIASLITGHEVDPAVAMTGEVSLQGNVRAIGGLPEKLLAAQRAGVKKVFIPEENVDDLTDVAKEVQEALEIVPVSTIAQVFKELGMPGIE